MDLLEENKALKNELSLLSEKFHLMQVLHQNQSKLIELFLRLEMIRECNDQDKKETDDLQRKIQLCVGVIEEYNVKYSELCNDKRRAVIVSTNEPEKKAAIWDHFIVRGDQEGAKIAECSFCQQEFSYKSLTSNKCREHINDRCEKAPLAAKTQSTSSKKSNSDSQQKSRFNVWNYFLTQDKNGKSVITCSFCGVEYSSRNATKCREHLAFKCSEIEAEVRDQMRSTFSQDYINSVNHAKRSTIWEHFNIIIDDEDQDKMMIQCIYCCINYANKNATKCREHLLDRCDKIPTSIRHRINNTFFDSPLKTWTQVKVPIWKHFSVTFVDERRCFKCNYCEKLYSSKNVTKFRLHLLTKCTQIADDVKDALTKEVGLFQKDLQSLTVNQNGEIMMVTEDEKGLVDNQLMNDNEIIEMATVYEKIEDGSTNEVVIKTEDDAMETAVV
ncbi:hypothetical protein TYRP_004643 [Tyrophagus putrescentiae]|nr:hypothetical protein TYRP_004643 [Tyrophagus putrescentiae]